MLEIGALSVRYGSVSAVRGLSLECREGEIVSLIGPNGAGKSSALLAVAGALRSGSVSGEIRFDGRVISGLRPEQIVRQGLSLVPESRRIFGTMTVEENLLLGATTSSDWAQVQTDLEGLMARFPVLGRKRAGQAGALSGGEQQQLAVARALMGRPRLVMLDEPTLGLSPLLVDEIFDLVVRLRAEGTTVLLVEQNALRALEVSDRCYVLAHGELEREGTSRAMLHDPKFVESYFGGSVEMEVLEK